MYIFFHYRIYWVYINIEKYFNENIPQKSKISTHGNNQSGKQSMSQNIDPKSRNKNDTNLIFNENIQNSSSTLSRRFRWHFACKRVINFSATCIPLLYSFKNISFNWVSNKLHSQVAVPISALFWHSWATSKPIELNFGFHQILLKYFWHWETIFCGFVIYRSLCSTLNGLSDVSVSRLQAVEPAKISFKKVFLDLLPDSC